MSPANADQHFSGQITVAARIIDLLSSGLYESPASCLKELINNSFDADARQVDFFVKPDANRIIIEDDGQGMNREEFERHFRRIAESHKRDDSDHTASGRPKIGKIGIGVVAANELCEKLEIFSTKQGSRDLLHVTIDFEEMRKSPEKRKTVTGEFVKADYYGEILPTERSSHFTKLFLTNVKGQARDILAGVETAKQGAAALTLYGKNVESIEKLLRTSSINTWSDFDFYSKTLLEISLNVPVAYFEHWVPPRLKKQVLSYEQKTKDLNFSVTYDGIELRKPIVFSGDGHAFIRKFSYSGKSVSADGYFYAQHGSVKPIELHGLLVRIRNAAIGHYDSTFWGFSASEYSLIQRWVSCEIWADEQLEDAMNIDRRTLRVTHPAYVELRTAIHTELRSVFSATRERIYEANSRSRKASKSSTAAEQVAAIIKSAESDIDAETRRSLISHWKRSDSPDAQKALLRKYSVAEFYAIVIEVAKATLNERQRSEFLRRLTDRLNRE
jgi:hypothetical protein